MMESVGCEFMWVEYWDYLAMYEWAQQVMMNNTENYIQCYFGLQISYLPQDHVIYAMTAALTLIRLQFS